MSAWTWFRSTERPWIDAPGQWHPDTDEGPERVHDGELLHLVLDAENPANALSSSVLGELRELTRVIERERGVRAAFLWSGKAEHFIAGADIDEIAAVRFEASARSEVEAAHAALKALADLPWPTFAVISGTCLGGGLELALACDYRIAVDRPEVRIGLPEVRLGIFPGFGGSQRLPRLIGLRAALGVILGAPRLPAKAALRKGIVDAVVPADGASALALRAAADLLASPRRTAKRRRRLRGGLVSLLLEGTPPGRAFIRRQALRQVARQTGGHYPAPPAAVETCVDGFAMPLERALELEARNVAPLVVGPVAKNLIALFRASEAARKPDGLLDSALEPPRTIPRSARLAVLGAGVMGGGIAGALAEKGFRPRLRDLDPEALRRGLAHIGDRLSAQVRRRRLTPREREAVLDRLAYTTSLDGFGGVGAVFEAIVERLEVKRRALAEMEEVIPPDALFLTNTSAIPIAEIQREARHPGRVVGLHFFNPVDRMPLVEVIPGPQTHADAVYRAAQLAVDLGKYPVVVQDSPGFLVNRLLFPYLDSACSLLDRGISGPAIDGAARRFGLPMGPFRLLDEVGIDVAVEVSETLYAAFGERARPSALLASLVERGRLGRKSGLGFYRHDGKPAWVEPREAAVQSSAQELDPSEIVSYLLDRQIDEAARCLEEGIVGSARDVDLAMIMGTGFPPFLGGPLRYADTIGVASVADRLRTRAQAGDRCAPCDHLQRLARGGAGFHTGIGAAVRS